MTQYENIRFGAEVEVEPADLPGFYQDAFKLPDDMWKALKNLAEERLTDALLDDLAASAKLTSDPDSFVIRGIRTSLLKTKKQSAETPTKPVAKKPRRIIR
jgi:hypothetical protein